MYQISTFKPDVNMSSCVSGVSWVFVCDVLAEPWGQVCGVNTVEAIVVETLWGFDHKVNLQQKYLYAYSEILRSPLLNCFKQICALLVSHQHFIEL